MEIVQLNANTWVIQSPVNMSLIQTDGGLVALDTGVDKQAGKTILKAAKELGLELCAIINTHAHADHYGGNAQILRTKEIPVYAPFSESLVMMNPRIEPEYLWFGASPLSSLCNKFLLAEPSPVTSQISPDVSFEIHGVTFTPIALPGHAHGQVGIVTGNVLFAADAYFDPSVVDKHGIPFMVDYEKTITSAKQISATEVKWYVPGHGNPTEDPTASIRYLIDRHEKLIEFATSCFDTGPQSVDDLVSQFCRELELSPQNPGAFTLLRTPVAAYVTALVEQGIIDPVLHQGVLRFTRQ